METKISKSNSKLGKVWNVSLTPIKACKGCEAVCGKDCYAMKSYRMYPNVRVAWDHNLSLAESNQSKFFSSIADTLSKAKKQPKFFRWHVAGDILNTDYVLEMDYLARKFPNVKFLAFTKQYNFVNAYLNRGNAIAGNLTIVFSAWPGLSMDNRYSFPVAWMQDGSEDRVTENALECPGYCETCGLCWALPSLHRDVVFNKH